MSPLNTELLQGTLDLLILKTLTQGLQHGYGISLRIQEISKDALKVRQGSLYPALHRLERKGWISASWGDSDNNRKAKFYELTPAGRSQLAVEKDNWERLADAVRQIIQTA